MQVKLIQNIKLALKNIRCDDIGLAIMSEKTEIISFEIKNIKFTALNILKQNALSVCAEVATPRGAILGKKESYNCVLFGKQKELKLLSKKLLIQPFGLKNLGEEIGIHLKNLKLKKDPAVQVMGVVNVQSGSFYESASSTSMALDKIYEHINYGANIIDIGASSTAPGTSLIESSQEIARLKDLFKEIKSISSKAIFSIDTYNYETAKLALSSGFGMINDVSGLMDIRMLELLKECSYVLTHTKEMPLKKDKIYSYNDLFLEMDLFFTHKLELLNKVATKEVIIDVGIGFGKNTIHNLDLIVNLKHFKKFNKKLLIGASHKSFLGDITNTKIEDRLIPTIIAHLKALKSGANIIRVHDVKSHMLALNTLKAFNKV